MQNQIKDDEEDEKLFNASNQKNARHQQAVNKSHMALLMSPIYEVNENSSQSTPGKGKKNGTQEVSGSQGSSQSTPKKHTGNVIRNESSGYLDSPAELTLQQIQEKYPLIVNQNHKSDDLIRCDICLQLHSEDNDQMVICEGCLGAVHQSCYMMELKDSIPEGDWICQRCNYLKTKVPDDQFSVRCGLCTDIRGVMTQVSSGHFLLDWVHPICILWNPYLYYKDFSLKTTIQGDAQEFRRFARKDKICAFCDDSLHKGYKIECDFSDCKKCFHVTCAANVKLMYECDKMIDDGLKHRENGDYVAVFCLEHKVRGLNIMHNPDKQKRIQSLKKRKAKYPFKPIQERINAATNLDSVVQKARSQSDNQGDNQRNSDQESIVSEDAMMNMCFYRPQTPQVTHNMITGLKRSKSATNNRKGRSKKKKDIRAPSKEDLMEQLTYDAEKDLLETCAAIPIPALPQLNEVQQPIFSQTTPPSQIYQPDYLSTYMSNFNSNQLCEALIKALQQSQQPQLVPNFSQQVYPISNLQLNLPFVQPVVQSPLGLDNILQPLPTQSQNLRSTLLNFGVELPQIALAHQTIMIENYLIALGIQKFLEIQKINLVLIPSQSKSKRKPKQPVIPPQVEPEVEPEKPQEKDVEVAHPVAEAIVSTIEEMQDFGNKLQDSQKLLFNIQRGISYKRQKLDEQATLAEQQVQQEQPEYIKPSKQKLERRKALLGENGGGERLKKQINEMAHLKETYESHIQKLNEEQKKIPSTTDMHHQRTQAPKKKGVHYEDDENPESPKKRDLKKDRFKPDSELFRLLKFIEDQQEKDENQCEKFQKIFVDPESYYSKADILVRFKQLMERLNVYEHSTNIYQLDKSRMTMKVFNEQISKLDRSSKKDEGYQLQEIDLWPLLIRQRCKRYRNPVSQKLNPEV